MTNIDHVAKENAWEHNPHWPQIPDQPVQNTISWC